jgi:putative hydrolases of HD superfamily
VRSRSTKFSQISSRNSKPESRNALKKAKNKPSPATLLASAGKLKRIKRAGWMKKVGITAECESVADHSFRMAILGAYVGIERGLDQAKIVRMCLIHDLAESELGDLTPEQKSSEESHRIQEDVIMRKILETLPLRSRERLLSDWQELFEGETEEAKTVWQLDKLEMCIQSKDYEKAGYEKVILKEFQRINALEESLRSIARLYPLTI